MTLVQAMRAQCRALEPDTQLRDAAHMMADSGEWMLPVCSGPLLIGTLSLMDLAKHGIASGPEAQPATVRDAMNSHPYQCSVEASLEDARDQLCAHRTPVLCVTTAAGALVGVVDAFDVIESLGVPHAFAGPEPDYAGQARGVH